MFDVLFEFCGRSGFLPSSVQLDWNIVTVFELPYQAEQAVVASFKHILLADPPFLSGMRAGWHMNNRSTVKKIGPLA